MNLGPNNWSACVTATPLSSHWRWGLASGCLLHYGTGACCHRPRRQLLTLVLADLASRSQAYHPHGHHTAPHIEHGRSSSGEQCRCLKTNSSNVCCPKEGYAGRVRCAEHRYKSIAFPAGSSCQKLSQLCHS